MRIGIDARLYGPRTGGGIGRYVAELISHLQRIDRVNSYVLFLRKDNFHECTISNANFTKRMVDVPWYSFAEQRVLPREVAAANVQFMHYPHWNVPIFSRVPFVVTIHDLILVEDPMSANATTRNPFLHGIKYVGFRTALENAVHRSKRIIAISEYTKASLLGHFRVRAQKISVVHNGVGKVVDHSHVNLRALGVYDPYFLYVGNAYPHKNLDTLVQAFAQFRKKNTETQLVIAGRRDAYSKGIELEAKRLGIPAQAVRFIDFPSDEELGALYAHAHLFVFPSRIEGFGIPPLEAMMYGTPVAAARATSIPEVLKEYAAYFDPDDVGALAEIMHTAATGKIRNTLDLGAARRHAETMTWEQTARKTLECYAAVGARRV